MHQYYDVPVEYHDDFGMGDIVTYGGVGLGTTASLYFFMTRRPTLGYLAAAGTLVFGGFQAYRGLAGPIGEILTDAWDAASGAWKETGDVVVSAIHPGHQTLESAKDQLTDMRTSGAQQILARQAISDAETEHQRKEARFEYLQATVNHQRQAKELARTTGGEWTMEAVLMRNIAEMQRLGQELYG